MAVKYQIRVDKEGANVAADFDVSVTDMASTELLSSFHLNVEGENLVADFRPGQKAFTGARHYLLKKPDQDAPVSFDLSSNVPWKDSGTDTLRGSKYRDQANFEN